MTDGTKISATRVAASVLTSLSIATTAPAMAYVDPGTGSMLVQMAIAGVAGAMFYFRQLRMTAMSWFRRVVLRQEPAPDSSAAAVETDGNR
ncbi:MAG: hypothetical protein U1E63_17005 [Burkholderiales bacterium]